MAKIRHLSPMERIDSMGYDRSSEIADIVTNYSPQLRSYIGRMVKNSEDAEDILQDVFYQLTKVYASNGSEISKIASWLFKVARNTVLNFWRHKSNTSIRIFGLDDNDSVCSDFSHMLFDSAENGPEQKYLRKLVWQELEFALNELPIEQREVFCLTVFDSIPVKDISKSTGIPVATLLSRKHYAVKFLRSRLQGLYEDILNY